METRISVRFDYPPKADEKWVKEQEDTLMEWARLMGYKSPMLTGSLFFREVTFSWVWGDMPAQENFDRVLAAQAKIGEFFIDKPPWA